MKWYTGAVTLCTWSEFLTGSVVFLMMVCSFSLIQLGCGNPTGTPDGTQSQPVTIIVSDYDLPDTYTTWEYQFSDGSTLSSSSVILLPNGREGFVAGADTMVVLGNSLVELRYGAGFVVEFRYGGLLLQPYGIADGSTYTDRATGYLGDNAILTLEVQTRYSLEYNVGVGTAVMDTMLYARTNLTASPMGTGGSTTERVFDYRARGLGTLMEVDSTGNVLRVVTRLIGNGQVLFP